jgi:hypothetical protein
LNLDNGIQVEKIAALKPDLIVATDAGVDADTYQVGDVLPVGDRTDAYPELDQAPVAAIAKHLVELLVVPGPRDDWVVDPDTLVRTIWMASDRSNRVGIAVRGTASALPLLRSPVAQRRCHPRRDPGAARPAHATALVARQGCAGFCFGLGCRGALNLVNQQCGHRGTYRPPGSHRRPQA